MTLWEILMPQTPTEPVGARPARPKAMEPIKEPRRAMSPEERRARNAKATSEWRKRNRASINQYVREYRRLKNADHTRADDASPVHCEDETI